MGCYFSFNFNICSDGLFLVFQSCSISRVEWRNTRLLLTTFQNKKFELVLARRAKAYNNLVNDIDLCHSPKSPKNP